MTETFWRDEWGNLKFFILCLIVIFSFSFLIGLVMGIGAIGDYYEVKAFNRIHETDYTFAEWFWAKETIKEYHLGKIENKNYNVDLNVRGLEK